MNRREDIGRSASPIKLVCPHVEVSLLHSLCVNVSPLHLPVAAVFMFVSSDRDDRRCT